MICFKCGAEIPEGSTICPVCHADLTLEFAQTDFPETGSVPEGSGEAPAAAPPSGIPDRSLPSEPETPKSGKKGTKLLIAAGAVAVAGAAAAFAFAQVNARDPKEAVTDAFKTAFSHEQVSPMEELFGLSQFSSASASSNVETGLTLSLDNSSMEALSAFTGGGLRFSSRNDLTNKKSDANVGIVYNGMDVANLDFYYGDSTLMAAIPELSEKVLTLDLSDGLADRIKNSPAMSRLFEENGISADAVADYLSEAAAMAEENAASGGTSLDLPALMDRYREGCKAQESFNAALTVEKAEKSTVTVNGKEKECRGYSVLVSKAAMIDFLRTSSDFFLQDEALKGQYLRQLELSVKLNSLMGGSVPYTAGELQADAYEEAKAAADQMIEALDASLTDIQMTVYLDKDGALTSVLGSTVINSGITSGDGGSQTVPTEVVFEAVFEGGAYPLQNLTGQLTIGTGDDAMSLYLVKQGVYDDKKLTCDVSLNLMSGTGDSAQAISILYSGSYIAENGDYHVSLETADNGVQLFKVSASGIVNQLEKGTSIQADIDSLEISTADSSLIFSGNYYFQPLSGEIAPLEGTPMDVLAATEDDWYSLIMEGAYGFMEVADRLGISLY